MSWKEISKLRILTYFTYFFTYLLHGAEFFKRS